MIQILLRLHDAATRALFALAWLALAFAGILFVYGVVARYFFNSPSTWAGEGVSYCLAVLIFAALPDQRKYPYRCGHRSGVAPQTLCRFTWSCECNGCDGCMRRGGMDRCWTGP